MFWNKKQKQRTGIEWEPLTEVSQLENILEESKDRPVLIYKHSTRCGISGMALNRLERSWDAEGTIIKPYFLDLISYRNISNIVEEMFGVYHESPQVILVKNGKAVYDDSHMGISFSALKQHV